MSCRLFFRRQNGGLFLGSPRHPEMMRVKPFPIEGRGGRWGSIRQFFPRNHLDAINRARRYTQLASGAECGDDRVHLLASTDNRINRAGRQALGAANTGNLIDLRDQSGPLNTVGRIERQHVTVE